MFNTNISIRISLTAVVLAAAIASASTVLEIGIINGSQAQVTPSPTNTTISPALKSSATSDKTLYMISNFEFKYFNVRL